MTRGDLYVQQDANWNVIGTTDLGGSVIEANVLTPYGQLTVNQPGRVHLDAPFSSAHSGSEVHDHAPYIRYVYDAWNRLVKVQASEDSGAVTIQTAEFDATGRRMTGRKGVRINFSTS